MTSPITPDNTNRWPQVLHLLKQFNQLVLGWAASLTWFRLALLAFIAMVAFSIISDKLGLQHDREQVKVAVQSQSVPGDDGESKGEGGPERKDDSKSDRGTDAAETPSKQGTENIEGCGNGDIQAGENRVAVCIAHAFY